MSGTILNVVAIIAGTTIGILIGNRLSARMQESIMTGLGLVTLVIGLQSAFESGNIILPLLSLVIGVILGELLDMDAALRRLGGWLQARVAGVNGATAALTDDANAPGLHMDARTRFVKGFVTASLLFGVGPLAILGSIRNGMDAGDVQLLAVKSTLDFFAATAFASSLGIGVAFSSLPILVLQGAFALVGMAVVGAAGAGGAVAGLAADNPFIREFTATGGLILMGLALGLLEIKQPRVANFLPALVIIPLLVALAGALGISIYPV
ncbi:MAG: DUF554 domain-containing protein [Anaerolineae bacterium]|nr:DUF554 domain-containing protein [Anaerolineae bacterium]